MLIREFVQISMAFLLPCCFIKETTMKRLLRIFILVAVALFLYLSNARAVPIIDSNTGQGGFGGENKGIAGEATKQPI